MHKPTNIMELIQNLVEMIREGASEAEGTMSFKEMRFEVRVIKNEPKEVG